DLLDGEALDDVVLPDVVVARDLDAALVALDDFLHVVLEALEALDLARVHHLAVPDQAALVAALHLAGDHDAAGDRADAGDPEDLLDRRRARLLLHELGLEEALEGGLHLLDRL